MKKSTRALVGMVVLDLLLLIGIWWLVMQINPDGSNTNVPPQEAISTITITSIGGGAIGIISVILLLAFFHHRRKGN
jgi:hypothetical protein